MKKTFLILVTFFFISCSNNESSLEMDEMYLNSVESNTTLKSNLQDFENLYISMLNSQSHKKLQKDLTAFIDKCNSNTFFVDEQHLHQWLIQNISSTDFRNYEEAVLEWEIIVEDISQLRSENNQYFTTLENIPTEEFIRILDQHIPQPPSIPGVTSNSACLGNRYMCLHEANEMYGGVPFGRWHDLRQHLRHAIAEMNLSNAISGCNSDYIDCIS